MTTSNSFFADTTFADLDLHDDLRRAVADLGFEKLTLVQDGVLPLSLTGRDIVAQAQTGSGKTAAYLLTTFNRLLTVPRTSDNDVPRALIVAPTRELAVQISNDAAALAQHTDLKVHVVFGGLDYRKQRKILEEGTDLLIGTPGRLIDYHRQGAYSLHDTEVVVIDECDRLFDMGFAEDLRWLMRRLPQPEKRQSMMFTATLSQRVITLGFRQMNRPEEVVINPEKLTPDTVVQELYHVASHEKLSLLLGLLEREGETRTMLFVNTRHQARRLVEDLQRHGVDVSGLTGSVIQTRRLKVLDDFRDGRLNMLVATDVASRGLHIDGVSHVINYDLPQDPEDYVHRIGRTARVGTTGMAISLACEEYVYSLDAIHKYIGYEIPTVFAGDELYAKVIPYRRPPREDPNRRRGRKAVSEETASEGSGSSNRRRRRRNSRDRGPNPSTGGGSADSGGSGGSGSSSGSGNSSD